MQISCHVTWPPGLVTLLGVGGAVVHWWLCGPRVGRSKGILRHLYVGDDGCVCITLCNVCLIEGVENCSGDWAAQYGPMVLVGLKVLKLARRLRVLKSTQDAGRLNMAQLYVQALGGGCVQDWR